MLARLNVVMVALSCSTMLSVGCTDAEERIPEMEATADAHVPPSTRPDAAAVPTPAPAPDGSTTPPDDRTDPVPPPAAPPPPPDGGVSIGPVPEDAAVPDSDTPRDDTPSLEPVDAGMRDEMDTPEPDPALFDCTGPADCEADQFCFFSRANRCGASGRPGRCVDRPPPGSCADAARPVCSCDGHTYPNACHAWEAGTDVAADSACPG